MPKTLSWKVRPIYHYRPDRVVNHVRLCFIAYWLRARLAREWTERGCQTEVPRLLRQLQSIRLARFRALGACAPAAITPISKELNEILSQLDLLKLFTTPPKWAENKSM